MPRNPADKQKRLLQAAHTEFSRYGIAGARVDRIAAQAGCNKSLIYSYFGNKEQLFEYIYQRAVAAVIAEVPFDAVDLPGYAARLFDYYQAHPEMVRLLLWQQLEQPEAEPPAALKTSQASRVAAIERQRQQHRLSMAFEPEDLLILVSVLARSWTLEPQGLEAPKDTARRRQLVIDAVKRLTVY